MESAKVSENSNFLPFEIRSELESLMFELFPLAWQLLKEYEEFMPYAAAKRSDGEIVYLMAKSTTERLSYQEQIDNLKLQLFELTLNEHLESVAIVFHGSTKTKDGPCSDAITFALEHISGEASRVHLPYRISIYDGLIIEKAIGKRAKPSIFTTQLDN